MLQTTDMLELQRIAKPDNCNYAWMRGCYVNGEKEKVMQMKERVLDLPNDEFYKYLNIARQVLSKKVENNALSLEFTEEELRFGSTSLWLKGAVASELEDTNMVNALFDRIIEQFEYTGNYLILLYSDTYDVPRIGSDGVDQEESEDVYKYILCAICPVVLTAEGLEFCEEMNSIRPRERDWVVQNPVAGFVYPAFEERTVEVNKVMFYTAEPGYPPHKLMEQGLGCKPVRTATETRECFERLFLIATESKDIQKDFIIAVNNKLNIMAKESTDDKKRLSVGELHEISVAAGIPEFYLQKIENGFKEEFPEAPKLTHLLNSKAIKAAAEKEKRKKIASMMREAVEIIETSTGKETELTYDMKNTINQYR